VAAVGDVLHFRIFDGDSTKVVDTDEKRLPGQARQIEGLREQLKGLWPPHALTRSEKDLIVSAVTSIVNQTQTEAQKAVQRARLSLWIHPTWRGLFLVSTFVILGLSGTLVWFRIWSPASVRRLKSGVYWGPWSFDLRLIPLVRDVNDIDNSGTNLVVVAKVQEVLYFRIFDVNGNIVVNTDEKRLSNQAGPIADLKRQLESLWPHHQLTRSERDRVINAATSIVGHTRSRHSLDSGGVILLTFMSLMILYALVVAPILVPLAISWDVARSAWGWQVTAVASLLVGLIAVVLLLLSLCDEVQCAALKWLALLPWWVWAVVALFVGVLLLFGMGAALAWLDRRAKLDLLFACDRVMALSSGVSPLLPLVLIGTIFVIWLLLAWQRVMIRYSLPPFPFSRSQGAGQPSPRAFLKGYMPIRQLIHSPCRACFEHDPLRSILVLGGTMVLMGFFCCDRPRTFDLYAFDWIFLFGFLGTLFLVATALLELLLLWRHVRWVLERIVENPIATALNHLPLRVKAHLGRSGWERPPWLALIERQQHALLAGLPAVQDRLAKLEGVDPVTLTRLRDSIHPGQRHSKRRLTEICLRSLLPLWKKRPAIGIEPEEAPQKGKDDRAEKPEYWHLEYKKLSCDEDPVQGDDDVKAWLGQAENLVAIQLVALVAPYFRWMRHLQFFLVAAPVLLVLAMTSYPFVPMRTGLSVIALVAGIAGGVMISVFLQMNRNEFLSRVDKTVPNRLTLDRSLVLNLTQFVLPLLGILIGLSTTLSDLVRTWLDPLLEMLG